MDPNRSPGIQLGQIVVEGAQFQHRSDYLTLEPHTKIDTLPLSMKVEFGLSADKRQGLIRLSVQTDRSARPLYAIDASIVAIVKAVDGHENMPLDQYAAVSGGAMLMPFMRELVANLTSRGRFGPIWLHPVNFTTVPFEDAGPVATKPEAATPPRAASGRRRKSRPKR
jgi:preprotein translocase subunit SecB